MMGGGSTRNR